jgi:diguanylate cyclase (GGDEF)-like protein
MKMFQDAEHRRSVPKREWRRRLRRAPPDSRPFTDSRPIPASSGAVVMTRSLAARVAGIVIIGAALLALETVITPADPRIGQAWPGLDAERATLLGVVFWSLLTLFASSVSAELPGGARLVWVLAPLVVVMSLGGPLVAAWVALIATTEPRELRGGVPWYGVLNNHTQFVTAAVVGATTMSLVRGRLALIGIGDPSFADLLATVAGGIAFETANFALSLAVVRAGRWRDVLPILLSRSFLASDGAQIIIGWLMARMYLTSGWWTPIVFVLPALLAWQAFDMDRMRWTATHDDLTELVNRREFRERLGATIARAGGGRRPSLLLLIDLDGFKSVNDSLGHAAGDDVLRTVAARLRAETRGGDHIARLGGDEFAVILTGIPRNAAAGLVRRLHAALTAPIAVADTTITIGASIGATAIDGSGVELEELLRQADVAMFQAKATRSGVAGLGIAGRVGRP